MFNSHNTGFLITSIGLEVKVEHKFGLDVDFSFVGIENDFLMAHNEISSEDRYVSEVAASKVEKISYFRQRCHNLKKSQ